MMTIDLIPKKCQGYMFLALSERQGASVRTTWIREDNLQVWLEAKFRHSILPMEMAAKLLKVGEHRLYS